MADTDLLGPGSGDEAARPLTPAERAFARDLANPDFSLSVPNVAKATIRRLLEVIDATEPAPEPDDREALADVIYDHLADTDEDGVEVGTCACGAEVPRSHGHHQADAIIAAGFRRHPEPVNPSREDVIEAVRDTIDRHGPTDLGYDETAALATAIADRALDTLWPGRSVAAVKAEALREFAEREWDNAHEVIGAPRDHYQGRIAVVEAARREADRIAAEGGAS